RGTTQIAYIKYATSQTPSSPSPLRGCTGGVYCLHGFGPPARKGWAYGEGPLPACTYRRLSKRDATPPSSSLPLSYAIAVTLSYFPCLVNSILSYGGASARPVVLLPLLPPAGQEPQWGPGDCRAGQTAGRPTAIRYTP